MLQTKPGDQDCFLLSTFISQVDTVSYELLTEALIKAKDMQFSAVVTIR